MNSSYSIASDLSLKSVFDVLTTLEEQHTAFIEFTVKREKGHLKLLSIEILFLPVEKENQST